MSALAVSTENAVDVLSEHGRTFRFASHLLGVETTHRAARLYRFCRWLDDLVDEGGDDPLNIALLEQVRVDLDTGWSEHPITRDFQGLAVECGLPLAPLDDLLEGLRRDTEVVRIEDVDDLLRYAYQVAGTVGLWMHAVLSASHEGSRAHAVDLGVGMQLSNIARDVHEDAARGRVYLPPEWTDGPLSPERILSDDRAVLDRVHHGRMRAVETARTYYRSAEIGLRDLPFRNRFAITTAALAYQEIGEVVIRRPRENWRERAVVSRGRKLHCAFRAFRSAFPRPTWSKARVGGLRHDPRLHSAFAERLGPIGGMA